MEDVDFLCEECGAEFTLLSEIDDPVQFCPYCGNELDYDEDDDEEFEEEEDFEEDDDEQ